MSEQILDCLKRKRDICIKNIIPSQNTAFRRTPALNDRLVLSGHSLLAASYRSPEIIVCKIPSRPSVLVDPMRVFLFYYPTLLPRVQILRETSTNNRYLYRPIPPGRVKFKTLASQNFGKRNRWIINLLLDVLVCSIAVYFYSLFVF